MEAQTESGLDTVTPVVAGDDRTRYDTFSIALHWITAALVLTQFLLGQTWDAFAKPTQDLMIDTHMTVGVLLTIVIVTRLVWRLLPGHRVPPIATGWIEVVSRSVHYLFYVLVLAQAALGFVLRWSGDEAMGFFGLEIPAPFPPFSDAAHDRIGDIHDWNGWAIIVFALAHAAAAFYHHYALHDRVLVRMAPWAKERQPRR